MSEIKSVVKAHKNDLALHRALLQRDGASKMEAEVVAYAEGKAGLAARLNPKENPK